jgi:uncharacterized membrane protein
MNKILTINLLTIITAMIPMQLIEAQEKGIVENFTAAGVEPFWSLKITNGGITFATPDRPQISYPYVNPLKAIGRPAEVVRVYHLRRKNSRATLVLKQVNNCSDTMSDRLYPYSATLIFPDRVFEGCAQKIK